MIRKRIGKSKIGKMKWWSRVRFHQTIIEDRTRTLPYKKAIEDNVESNDVVLDIGCGTGILSFFAAKKGCKKIYAIDNADIIDSAIETAKLNNLDKYIEFIKIDILKFKPREKIDVLIQEQIGIFIWDNDIIPKVAYIRDNYLKQGGIMIPFKIELYLVPSSHRSAFEKDVSFWRRKRYDIDFSNLSKEMLIQGIGSATFPSIVELESRKTFLCREKLVYTVDLRKDSKIPREITASFRLKKDSTLTGICGYFKVYLDEKHIISTSPRNINTAWNQFFLPYPEEKAIKRNSILNFTLFPKKNTKKWKFKFDIV